MKVEKMKKKQIKKLLKFKKFKQKIWEEIRKLKFSNLNLLFFCIWTFNFIFFSIFQNSFIPHLIFIYFLNLNQSFFLRFHLHR